MPSRRRAVRSRVQVFGLTAACGVDQDVVRVGVGLVDDNLGRGPTQEVWLLGQRVVVKPSCSDGRLHQRRASVGEGLVVQVQGQALREWLEPVTHDASTPALNAA
jgi:hypothetical protein